MRASLLCSTPVSMLGIEFTRAAEVATKIIFHSSMMSLRAVGCASSPPLGDVPQVRLGLEPYWDRPSPSVSLVNPETFPGGTCPGKPLCYLSSVSGS